MPITDVPIEIVHGRANPHIDPTLTMWGWEIPAYLFLGGLVAGLLVLTALLELTRGDRPRSRILGAVPFVAAALLSVGMLFLFLDLDYKLHVYRFYLAFMWQSPMSWGSWILMLVYPLAMVLGLGLLEPPDRARILARVPFVEPVFAWIDANLRPIAWGTVAVGSGLGIYTGLLLGTLAARPAWHAALLGPLFLVSGLSGGAAALLLLPLRDHAHHQLATWDAGAIALELVLLALLVIGFATGGTADRLAYERLVTGAWAPAFWSLVVVAGLAVPLVMELVGLRRRIHVAAIASVLVLAGGLALRFVIMGAGLDTAFRDLVG